MRTGSAWTYSRAKEYDGVRLTYQEQPARTRTVPSNVQLNRSDQVSTIRRDGTPTRRTICSTSGSRPLTATNGTKTPTVVSSRQGHGRASTIARGFSRAHDPAPVNLLAQHGRLKDADQLHWKPASSCGLRRPSLPEKSNETRAGHLALRQWPTPTQPSPAKNRGRNVLRASTGQQSCRWNSEAVVVLTIQFHAQFVAWYRHHQDVRHGH